MMEELKNSINELLTRLDAGERLGFYECDRFVDQIPAFTEKHSVEETRKFLEFIGSPDRKMHIIHVAGTNGKGSVCNYLSEILRQAGFSVGMFTSPHLVKVTERFCINGKPIEDSIFCEIFGDLLRKIKEYNYDDDFPSYFEFLFFMAMLLYEKYPVDYLVLETGLGGRLDATNSIHQPVLDVITEIGMDHMQYLGNTISRIAGEKAGIIRSNTPLVFCNRRDESTEVIEKRAEELSAKVYKVEPDYVKDIKTAPDDAGNICIDFSYESQYDKYCGLRLQTVAKFQIENAAIAIMCARALRDIGVNIADEDISYGLKKARWGGRMELILPGFYVDGAHNVDGMEAFLECAGEVPCEKKRTLLFGAVADKQYHLMIRQILESGIFDEVCVSVLETGRSVSESQLRAAFESEMRNANIERDIRFSYYTSVRDALMDIITERGAGDVVFAAGSLYLVGQVRETLGILPGH
ncbi:bifunctional folylpolyglutamate synthase/dihydrofolate synthase [Butyrivibrio sp. AD3002]|uniref:bifunctional folylpolyglutamate synthase/dihydrofolate synthase n=1 Tax=Butyrivibrio sp. AD3002 TaxID=1280670 RepID=UPI0003B634BB|nr:folylpolyglutamate synthase/dihydrofolate synthase family protein [Butyrivibrio sp. AD3002]